MTLFTAGLRLVCYVDGKPTDSIVSVVLLAAKDWQDAFAKALEEGKNLETAYKNPSSEDVAWMLAEIRTLDQLPGEELTGRELYVHRTPLAAGDSDPASLRPDLSNPGQTGV